MDHPAEKPRAETSVGLPFLLDDTARFFRRVFDAQSRNAGITALQWRLLLHVSEIPGVRQASLAERIEVKPIAISRMIDRLEEEGLIERRADRTDRRARLLFVTPAGERVMKQIQPTIDVIIADALRGLSSAEQMLLAGLMGRVRASLSAKRA